jgi:hypothetical protein
VVGLLRQLGRRPRAVATTAKERGRAPERLQDYLGPMTYRHYLVAERYDKFDIWKMMGTPTPSPASSAG